MTARPFDLKAALSGEPVVIDGDVCTFSSFERLNGECPLRFVAECGDKYWISLDGVYINQPVTMAPRKVKKTVWVNLTQAADGTRYWYEHVSPGAARGASCSELVLATAVPVEIEVAE